MRLRIFDSALEDLGRGREFYERQGEGRGLTFSIASSPKLIHWFCMRVPTEKSSDFIA